MNKKLSEYKDEEAIELLADLFEPVCEIIGDPELRKAISSNELSKAKLISIAIKNKKSKVMEVLAILDGVPVEEYHCNVFTLPIKLLEVLNDKDLLDFFQSQGLEMTKDASSGSAMGTIKAKGN